ncbi:hypothetical protein BCR36DRAFT_325511 [Piromyces finnis]|uniref:Agd3 CBM87 domain-containing protein n=1 Tax=Piromyces finnis TaxID=1754191 RepID=A0A1Y1VBR2_9FUNG|nr:hypothetical protein BCR36DRAFT_325511 [Piromyces finnis]|eukprot:ORX51381.1 hypothetical protein BCR36DRAFT_325511 [Piromyces finnis]
MKMNCKSIVQLAILLMLPLVAFCEDVTSDFLVITIENDSSNDYASAIKTFKQYDIPYNVFKIPKSGVSNEELDKQIYCTLSNGEKAAKYKVIVFPNGRVSYNHAESQSGSNWQSALTYDQWEYFYDYSRNYSSRLVFLNEYPSNYTSTRVYKEYKDEEAERVYQQKQILIAQEDISEAETINNSNLSTEGIYHFPAVIVDENNGISVEPLLFFSENSDIPEKTVAAVLVDNNGAQYAAFFMAFGEWSKDSTALNIVWLTWSTNKDFKHISGTQKTSEDAIKENGVKDYNKYEIIFVLITTVLTIIMTVF